MIAVLGVFLLGATPAWAHSELERSDPPNGGMVEVGRSTFTLWFTEAINADASSFDLHTQDGVEVDVRATVSEAVGGGVVQLEADPLAKATYVLDWRVLSEDGHPATGSVLFGVGTRPVAVASAAGTMPDPPAFLLRWIDLTAIMLAIGALVVSGRVLGSLGAAGVAPRRRACSMGALAVGVAVITGAITPLVSTQRGGRALDAWWDATWSTLTDTSWGHLWLAREIALVVAALALGPWARRRDPTGGRLAIAVVALAGVVVLGSWAGHASTLPSRSGLAALASATHLVAAGVWAGGLIVLAGCLIPVLRLDPDVRGPLLASAWRTYSPIAAIAAVVLVATGLYESGRHVPDLSAVTSTVYGGAVAGKVILVAVALALAGANTLLVNPRLASRVGRVLGLPAGWTPVPLRRFGTVVAIEGIVLVAAVGLAALLTSVPTARELATVSPVASPYSSNVGGLFVGFEEVPAGPDRTRVIVRTRSTVKPEPGPITGVKVVLAGPTGTTSDLSLEPVEPGRYEAETTTPGPGTWSATVAVQRTGVPEAVTQIRWTVRADVPERRRPLEVRTTALAVVMLTGLVGVIVLVRRRREPPETPRDRVAERAGSRG
ncbi:copper resistance protein CopC [Nocardioides sp.]|uniref:copper resistance CopC/CopD family protein n=1 Tax=Nocardioides sp. TaxID=35761 RepID=UPI0031FEF60A